MPTLGQRGDKLDLLIRQGATLGPFAVTMTDAAGEPVDLTGAIIRSAILKDYGSLVVFNVVPVITDAIAGKFTFGMAAIATAAIPYLGDLFEPANQYVWDLEIEYPDGTVQPVFWGIVQIAPEATVA